MISLAGTRDLLSTVGKVLISNYRVCILSSVDVSTNLPCHMRTILLQSLCHRTLHKKATIHQVTTMLANSEKLLFPGHNHLLTTSTDDVAQAPGR